MRSDATHQQSVECTLGGSTNTAIWLGLATHSDYLALMNTDLVVYHSLHMVVSTLWLYTCWKVCYACTAKEHHDGAPSGHCRRLHDKSNFGNFLRVVAMCTLHTKGTYI